jgi:hypothetical protein
MALAKCYAQDVDKEKAGWLVGLGGLLLIVSHFVRSKFHAYGWGMGNSKPTISNVRFIVKGPNIGNGQLALGCF